MIVLNEHYRFEKDEYCWSLHYYPIDKDGKRLKKEKTTYHPNLTSLSHRIIEHESGTCKSMQELEELYQSAIIKFTKSVEAEVKDER